MGPLPPHRRFDTVVAVGKYDPTTNSTTLLNVIGTTLNGSATCIDDMYDYDGGMSWACPSNPCECRAFRWRASCPFPPPRSPGPQM